MAKKKFYRYPLYLAARGLAGLLWALPRRAMLALTAFLGEAGFRWVGRHREKTLKHLRRAYGQSKTPAEIEKIARGVFRNMAMTAGELLQLSKFRTEGIDKIVDVGDAIKVYDGLLEEGKGILSMTAHLGNWELLAGTFGLKGYQGAVLGRRIYYEPYNRWIVGLRASAGVRTLYREDSSRAILKHLAANEIVGLLPDQDIDSLKGIFIDFFGIPAYTPVAPVRVALTSGAPIVTNFLIREGRERYRWVMGEVIRPVVETTREEAVRRYTAQWMASFERMIRAYPDQWAWMHDRWKTQPEKTKHSEPIEVEK